MLLLDKLDTLRGTPQELSAMKSPQQLSEDLARAKLLLWLAGIAAFMASAMFVVKYFVGGELTPSTWTGEQWINAALGLLLTLVITFGQGLLYVSGYKSLAAIIATAVVIFFGFFSEVSQSMEREDATVRQRSEQSPVFQTALENIKHLSSGATVPNRAQRELAQARGELHRWEAEQRKKAECHTCSKYSTRTIGSKIAQAKGQVQAAQEQVAAYETANTSALSTAITQAKSLEYDEEQHYAMIRLLQNLFSINGILASFLFSVVIIGTFEYIFHFVGSYVGNHRKALQLLGKNADGSAFAKTDSPQNQPSTANKIQPANTFARDYLQIDYHANQAALNTGFAPPQMLAHNNRTEAVATHVEIPDSAYITLCNLISEGKLKPSQPQMKKALQQLKIGKSHVERQSLASTLLQRMAKDGVIRKNPRYRGAGGGVSEFVMR